MKCHIYIQARMGSTRLPGKVLKTIMGKPLLSYLIERLRKVQSADDIIILTSKIEDDDAIVRFAESEHVKCFRGSENDVLDRFYTCSQEDHPDAIVRITSDCPLIDPTIVDDVINTFKSNNGHVDYVSNTLERTFPRGMDVEVFSQDALRKTHIFVKSLSEKEHVTLFMYRHPELFRLLNVKSKRSLPDLRLTVDTQEDFVLISKIFEHLYVNTPHFTLTDIVSLLQEHPDWVKINAHIEQKKVL